MTPILFLVAAGVGAVVRWRVSKVLARPMGTLAVNVAGAFALGLIDHWKAPELTVLGVGAIGALTTFSSLSDEIIELSRHNPPAAVGYFVITFGGGISAAALGMALAG